jgi:spermidine synthase
VKIKWQVIAFCAVQFVISVVCHGELKSIRPSARHLTLYYLWIATGSAVGGLFVILVAPRLFRFYWEFPLALLLIAIVVIGRMAVDQASWLRSGPAWLPFAMAFAMLVLVLLLNRFATFPIRIATATLQWMVLGAAAIVLFKLVRGRDQRAPFWMTAAVLTALGLWCGSALQSQLQGEYSALFAVRNFDGVVRVKDYFMYDAYERARYLEHGRTTHGLQLLHPEFQRTPTTYFGPHSGIGIMLSALPAGVPHRFGIVGLGAGTLAAYTKPGDEMVFYDINPAVMQISAGTKPYFTFVQQASGKITTVLGDGRLSLERELSSGSRQNFDVIALDAFSGDAVPVHLLTLEAFRIYLAHLKPDGVIAVNISNRNVDLQSPVAELCTRLNLDAVRVENSEGENREYAATWILVSPDHKRLLQPKLADQGWPITNSRHVKLWTDDYSNLIQILQ